jgi:cytochrome c peroxidase
VVNGSTTDPLLKNGIRLDIYEKNDLIIFLRTLTDSSFINDRRFSGN